jgi:hypothetical protein
LEFPNHSRAGHQNSAGGGTIQSLHEQKVVELVWKLREKGIEIERQIFTKEELMVSFDEFFRIQKT